MMYNPKERRTESRLRYHWPVWFAADFNQELSQGQMVDVSSGGAAFTFQSDGNCPDPGQELTARFSVPRFGRGESFEMANFTRQGTVRRVEKVNDYTRRVAIQFAAPLPFKPGEQQEKKTVTQSRLLANMI